MPDRMDDHEAFLSSLEGTLSSPEGQDYRNRFLGRGAEHVRLPDMIRVARRQADEETRARVLGHVERCASCKSWLAAYERGWEEQQGKPEPAAASLDAETSHRTRAKQEQKAAHSTPPASLPDQSALTGINTNLARGEYDRAFAELRPYLPGILEAVGLSQTLADRLLDYIRQRKPPQIVLPPLLRDFAREVLHFSGLPVMPPVDAIMPVVERVRIRACLAAEEMHADQQLRLFLEEARRVGVKSFVDLRNLQLRQPRFSNSTLTQFVNRTGFEIAQSQRKVRDLWVHSEN